MPVFNTKIVHKGNLHWVTITTQFTEDIESLIEWKPSRILYRHCIFEDLASDVKFLERLQYIWLMQRAKEAKKGRVIHGAWGSTEIYNEKEQAEMVAGYMRAMHPSQAKYAQFDPKEVVKVSINNVNEEDAKDFFD